MEKSLRVFHSTEPYNWLTVLVEKWYIAKTFPKKVKADSICSLLISLGYVRNSRFCLFPLSHQLRQTPKIKKSYFT